eukprot:288961-Pleurochrysis_carterae.AAC.1
MPNEPVIVCRSVTWEAVYEEEYVKDMNWWEIADPLSRSKWSKLKEDGLNLLSAEYFGVEDDGVTPLCMLSIKLRPSHSNFGACA